MKLLVWAAEHAAWISIIGALIAIAIKFERWLPKWLHRTLFFIDVFIVLAAPLLAALKSHLDDKWRTEMQTQAEAQQKQIEEIRETAGIKPFKERLISCLNGIDSRILPALAAGTTHFSGNLKPYQFSELQKLAAEPDGPTYIHFRAEPALAFGPDGTYNPASFDLDPALLAK